MAGVFRGIVDRFVGIVESINGLYGAVTLYSSDSSVTITPSGTQINLQSSGGGGGSIPQATFSFIG